MSDDAGEMSGRGAVKGDVLARRLPARAGPNTMLGAAGTQVFMRLMGLACQSVWQSGSLAAECMASGLQSLAVTGEAEATCTCQVLCCHHVRHGHCRTAVLCRRRTLLLSFSRPAVPCHMSYSCVTSSARRAGRTGSPGPLHHCAASQGPTVRTPSQSRDAFAA